MIFSDPYRRRGPSFTELMVGYLFGLLGVVIALAFLVHLIRPLLPWIGFGVIVAGAVRWCLGRESGW